MLILGVDTSGKNGSIALVDCRIDPCRTIGVVPLEGGTFSAQLVPQIADLLQKHGFSKRHIDAFVVVSGPGSFTGLRVGLAAIKALAEILQKPIAPVSLLEAIAITAKKEGRLVTVLDAGRGEIYAGTYEVRNGQGSCVSEQLLTISEVVCKTAGLEVITSDLKLADALRHAAVTLNLVPQHTADVLAQIGFAKIKAGKIVNPEILDATYIRRSDAEMKFTERQNESAEILPRTSSS